MKKYYQIAIYPVSILGIACILSTLVGILVVTISPSKPSYAWGLIGVGCAVGVAIILPCLIGVLCSPIQMNNEKIVFPTTSEPNFRLKEFTVKIEDIKSITTYVSIGDGLFTSDTRFYVFQLKNGDTFRQAFFSYGKKNEAEIINALKQEVEFIEHVPV